MYETILFHTRKPVGFFRSPCTKMNGVVWIPFSRLLSNNTRSVSFNSDKSLMCSTTLCRVSRIDGFHRRLPEQVRCGLGRICANNETTIKFLVSANKNVIKSNSIGVFCVHTMAYILIIEHSKEMFPIHVGNFDIEYRTNTFNQFGPTIEQ